MISNVRGSFSGVNGTVVYDPENVGESTIEADIDTSTLNTSEPNRDAHVKSPEFLDVEKFPTIRFQSTSVAKDGDGLKVHGHLTIHGVTKPVTLHVEEIAPESQDPWGNTRIGASARTKIKRSDFGLTWNTPLETGGVMLGDELKLEFDVQLIKAKDAVAA